MTSISADKNSGLIRLLSANLDREVLHVLNLHKAPVQHIKVLNLSLARCVRFRRSHAAQYNDRYGYCISTDDKGDIEYWSSEGEHGFPEDSVKFEFKTDTDLWELVKVCT